MVQWRELFDYSIIANSSDKNDPRKSCLVNHKDLDYNALSPVTNLMLNALIKIFDSEENLIINFPKKILKPIPLMAYIFAEMKSKSTLVFTAGNINNKKDLIRVHNDNYYLLTFVNKWGSGANLYENCSMGYLKNKGELSYKFFLPHANSEHKKEVLSEARNKVRNKLRRASEPEQIEQLKAERDGLTAEIGKLRKDIKIAEFTLERSQQIQNDIEIELNACGMTRSRNHRDRDGR